MARRYGLVFDLERCIGCRTCLVACKMENGLEKGSRIRVETIGGPYQDTPAGKYPHLWMYFQPVICMQCETMSCRSACAMEAIYRREDGIVMIDHNQCNRCEACIEACPFKALFYSEEKDKIEKCDFCAHRVDQGLEPFCATCCEGGAICFGDLNDPTDKIQTLISQKKPYVLKQAEDHDVAVYYINSTKNIIQCNTLTRR